MASDPVSRWTKIRTAAENFLQEKGIESQETFARSRLSRFAHFWLLVFKSFIKNRCPVRSAALAYTTLLALIPLLAVAVSITTSMLKKQGEKPVRALIDNLVSYAAPALDLTEAPASTNETSAAAEATATNAPGTNAAAIANTNAAVEKSAGKADLDYEWIYETDDPNAPRTGRDRVVEQITEFIGKIDSNTLGVTGVLALLFVAISLLRTIEAAFNDIWGATRGRGWVKSIVYYWATITLGTLFLVASIVITTGTRVYLGKQVGFFGSFIATLSPFVILSLGFSAFYALMPNTKVHYKAALVGGIVGGCLWQLNNLFNVIYVSRAVSYTSIYGGLAVFPLFLVGLYFSWLIMLFGSQVAYAFQNREAYIEERQAESVNQRGREFIALRVMTLIAERFLKGEKPLSLVEISCALNVPSQLVTKLVTVFVKTGLLVEVADVHMAYSPARPIDTITAHDVLRSLRAGHGIELATKEDQWRTEVRAEFEKILDAERQAGQAVTLEALAINRGEVAKAIA